MFRGPTLPKTRNTEFRRCYTAASQLSIRVTKS